MVRFVGHDGAHGSTHWASRDHVQLVLHGVVLHCMQCAMLRFAVSKCSWAAIIWCRVWQTQAVPYWVIVQCSWSARGQMLVVCFELTNILCIELLQIWCSVVENDGAEFDRCCNCLVMHNWIEMSQLMFRNIPCGTNRNTENRKTAEPTHRNQWASWLTSLNILIFSAISTAWNKVLCNDELSCNSHW